MKYTQNGIEFNFELVNEEREWFATVSYRYIKIEFFIEVDMFKFEFFNKTKFDWENVQVFTEHVLSNIKYLDSKSRMWMKMLYNGIGRKLEQQNTFDEEKGDFRGILAVRLVEVNRHDKNNFYYDACPFHWSEIGAEMDCYHSYQARFRHIGIDYPCFEGIMRHG